MKSSVAKVSHAAAKLTFEHLWIHTINVRLDLLQVSITTDTVQTSIVIYVCDNN